MAKVLPRYLVNVARYALSEARKVGINDPAIMIVDTQNPIALEYARSIASVPQSADALVVTWGRKADVVALMERVVPGSQTARTVAEQLAHDKPYLISLGDEVMISSWDLPDEELLHITFDTQHCASISQTFVWDKTIRVLAPLVQAGGGRIPNTPFAFSIREHDGAATIDFQYVIGGQRFAVVVGTVCERRSREWWEHLLHTAHNAGFRRDVAEPSATPWLGVVLLPGVEVPSAAESHLLCGLENWVAWTWLRRHEVIAASIHGSQN
jgi:hypothetical protein